jgi:asparaginyl-tRNA synthetase
MEILRESNYNKKKKFQYPITGWGMDFQSEHERYLVEKHFKRPVILTNYPAAIKAFYMRQDDPVEGIGQTVAAMDILAPGIGEIVGGSQREERLDKLLARMKDMNIPAEDLWWYLDTRRFGTVPHAGFGLGFERMVQFVTGMTNIRDVIAFPRTPKNAEF